MKTLALFLFLVLTVGCGQGAGPGSPKAPPAQDRQASAGSPQPPTAPGPQPAPKAAGLESPAPGPGATGNRAREEARRKFAHHRHHKPPVVGGCGDNCQDPASAFRAFARRLLLPRERTGNLPRLETFLDSSELVYEGQPLGSEWVLIWKAGLLEERAARVHSFTHQLRARVGTATDPDDFLVKLDRPLDIQRLSAVDVELVFAMPGTGVLTEGEPWRFSLGKRGLEWLIKGIDGPQAPGGNDVRQ